MSFFNYVDSTDYDLTNEDMLRCCYDEVVAEYTDTGDIVMCNEKFLQDAARFKLEDFKNWMRPLFTLTTSRTAKATRRGRDTDVPPY